MQTQIEFLTNTFVQNNLYCQHSRQRSIFRQWMRIFLAWQILYLQNHFRPYENTLITIISMFTLIQVTFLILKYWKCVIFTVLYTNACNGGYWFFICLKLWIMEAFMQMQHPHCIIYRARWARKTNRMSPLSIIPLYLRVTGHSAITNFIMWKGDGAAFSANKITAIY